MPKEPTAEPLAASKEQERWVLGAALCGDVSGVEVVNALRDEDFAYPHHKALLAALRAVVSEGGTLDATSLIFCTQELGTFDAVGGYSGIQALDLPTGRSWRYHLAHLREYSQRRALSSLGNEIKVGATDPRRDMEEWPREIESRIVEIEQEHREHQDAGGMEMQLRAWGERQEELRAGKRLAGYPTGIKALDGLLAGHGLARGRLYVVAGRPGMGKSTLALNLALNLAAARTPVYLFSAEDDSETIINRWMARVIPQDSLVVQAGLQSKEHLLASARIQGLINELPICCDTRPRLTLSRIATAAKAYMHQIGIGGVLIVDYINLYDYHRLNDNTAAALGAFAQGLRDLAKETGCSVVALSQLNRAVEQRPNHKPQLSDLRDSGAIEQIADTIIFLYADSYYKGDDERAAPIVSVDAIVEKQKVGCVGTAKLRHDKPHCYIGDGAIVQDCIRKLLGMEWRPAE